MPYLSNYLELLDNNEVEYSMIIWDRLYEEEKSEKRILFRTSQKSYRQSLFGYIRYSLFVKQVLKRKKPKKVIVFGIPLLAFMWRYLCKHFTDRFIVDIRDYHKSLGSINMHKINKSASAIVISSEGFKKWLPNGNYIVSHNSSLFGMFNATEYRLNEFDFKSKINVSYIGAIRDSQINRELINNLSDYSQFSVHYYGFGFATKNLSEFVNDKQIKNVRFFGRYDNNNVDRIYEESDIINILIPKTNTNSLTLMPNRLYNAVLFCKPIVCLKGTFVAEVVEEYRLGLVVEDFNCLGDRMIEYINGLKETEYMINRDKFISKVMHEDSIFKNFVVDFSIEKQM
jgi:hypothetical protein